MQLRRLHRPRLQHEAFFSLPSHTFIIIVYCKFQVTNPCFRSHMQYSSAPQRLN